jgi:hypothetical protein
MKTNWKELIGGRVLIQKADFTDRQAIPMEVVLTELSPSGKCFKALWVMSNQSFWQNCTDFEVLETLPPESPQAVAMLCHKLIESLRNDCEGASVMIPCDNPDPDGHDDQVAVDVMGDWNGFKEERFYADTLLNALMKADSKRQAVRDKSKIK